MSKFLPGIPPLLQCCVGYNPTSSGHEPPYNQALYQWWDDLPKILIWANPLEGCCTGCVWIQFLYDKPPCAQAPRQWSYNL